MFALWCGLNVRERESCNASTLFLCMALLSGPIHGFRVRILNTIIQPYEETDPSAYLVHAIKHQFILILHYCHFIFSTFLQLPQIPPLIYALDPKSQRSLTLSFHFPVSLSLSLSRFHIHRYSQICSVFLSEIVNYFHQSWCQDYSQRGKRFRVTWCHHKEYFVSV